MTAMRPRPVGEPALDALPPEVRRFDFRGNTRTSNKKPRIAIVTNAVAYPYSEKTTAHWSLFKEYFANKDCYANTHGYDLIVESRCSSAHVLRALDAKISLLIRRG